MANILLDILKYFVFIVNIHNCLSSEANITDNNKFDNPISSEEKLTHLYLNDLKTQADFSKNPCDNYELFACGNLRETDQIGYRFNKKDAFYIENILLKNTPQNAAEKCAKDFYLSCVSERDIKQIFEQVPTLKAIGKWPTNKIFTSNEIAELMAEMAAIAEMFFIKIQIKQNQIYVEGIQPLGSENIDNITKLMEEFGTSNEESQSAANDIVEFLGKLENLYRYFSPDTITDVQFQNRNILQRKIPNFNWNTYLKKFFNSLNLKMDLYNYEIRTKNFELLEKVASIIEKTDHKTLVNYLIYKYIQFGMKHNCEEYLPYFRPIVILKLWEKYMTPEDGLRHIEALNYFENSYNTVKFKLQNITLPAKIFNKIQNRRNIIINHTQILNNQIIQKHYESFDVIPNEIYTNQINFYHSIIREYIQNGENGIFNQIHLAFLEGLGGEIDIMANNKPLLYYFVSENIDIWRQVFSELKPWNHNQFNHDRTKCIDEGFVDDNSKIEFAANKQSYADYLKWAAGDDGVGLDDEAEYIEGFLNQKRAYFMALAQYQCFDQGTKNRPVNLGDKKPTDIFMFFSRLKDFSVEYGCRPGDKMHNYNFDCQIW